MSIGRGSRAFPKLIEQIKSFFQINCKIASGGGDKCLASLCDECKNDIVDNTHDVCGRIFGKAGLVFIQANIPAVMQAILDAP